MLDSTQLLYRTTELDSNLLASPFGAQTNWLVITGAPCSGKTTLIEQMAGIGFRTVPEAARQYFERETGLGTTLDEILADGKALQRNLADLQQAVERELRTSDLCLLDRALPDSLSFFRVFGLDPNELLSRCFHRRYASVFILDRLPFQRTETLGPEDTSTASFLDEWLARDYRTLGYDVVRVPVLAPQERCEFVLAKLSEQSLL